MEVKGRERVSPNGPVCQGRTSAWVKIGLDRREEVNLEAFLNQGRMS